MSKHTPGPWEIQEINLPQATAFDTYTEGSDCSSLSGTIIDNKGNLIAEVPIRGKAGFSKIIARDNARLIAAAPELLEALQQMIGALGIMIQDPDSDPYIAKARAAIAKAKE